MTLAADTRRARGDRRKRSINKAIRDADETKVERRVIRGETTDETSGARLLMKRSGLEEFLDGARRAGDVVSLVRQGGLSSVHGHVVAVGGDVIVISVVDENGRGDGVSAIRTRDVARAAINAAERARLAHPVE